MVGCIKSIAEETEPLIEYNHRLRPGSSAYDLLSLEKYTSLKIEVQYMAGFKPKGDALKELEQFLGRHLGKPRGITITTTEIPSITDSVLDVHEVRKIEDEYRTSYTNGHELAVYVLFTNGRYIDTNILGLAYQNTSVVLFGKHIENHSDKLRKPSRSDLESRVVQHEFGHLMGLVNFGAAPQNDHQHTDKGPHCKNKWCLMYYLTNTDDYPSFLLKKDPPALDEDCVADLKAVLSGKQKPL